MNREKKSENTTRQHFKVQQGDRERLLNQKGCVIWFTGLSGSGKSTLASALEQFLYQHQHLVYILDGDNLRHGLCRDLGFEIEERKENLRRAAEVASLFADAGAICICSFISPLEESRNMARQIIGDQKLLEIYLSTSLEACEKRDPKGLYQKARQGEIKNFTGIDSVYEKPAAADLELDTSTLSIDDCVDQLVRKMSQKNIIQING